jgi:hypothetical protein
MHVPVYHALTHHDTVGNRWIHPSAPPFWTTLFPPNNFTIPPTMDSKREKHKSIMDKLKVKQHALASRAIELADLLPAEHQRHIIENQGQYNCQLGQCSVWINVASRMNSPIDQEKIRD